MHYVSHRRGLSAAILSSTAPQWNVAHQAEYKYKFRAGGGYTGASDVKFSRDVYCFQHDINMMRRSGGETHPEWELVRWCAGDCRPDVRQGTKEQNCYNRDGLLGERTLAEISNTIGQHLAGSQVVYPSGRAWGAHWAAALDLSSTKFPPKAAAVVVVPAASDTAVWVNETGQQGAAVDACLEQGGTASKCGTVKTPDRGKAPPPVRRDPPPRRRDPPPAAESGGSGVVLGLLAAGAGLYFMTKG
jgi:hypothetical protein